MDSEVSLSQLESTANLVHFQTTDYLAKVVKDKTLFFQNVRRYGHEVNVLAVDEFYSTETIGVFCFSNDMRAVFDADMWHTYASKGLGKSVCIGFWEAGAEAVANSSGTLAQALELSRANHRLYVNNHHEMSEQAYIAQAAYLDPSRLDEYRALPLCTPEGLRTATEVALLTLEPLSLRKEYEQRFVILDCPDTKDIRFPSRFLRKAKLLVLGPDMNDHEALGIVQEYSGHIGRIWRASSDQGKITICRLLN